jgi:hypothetical protein
MSRVRIQRTVRVQPIHVKADGEGCEIGYVRIGRDGNGTTL